MSLTVRSNLSTSGLTTSGREAAFAYLTDMLVTNNPAKRRERMLFAPERGDTSSFVSATVLVKVCICRKRRCEKAVILSFLAVFLPSESHEEIPFPSRSGALLDRSADIFQVDRRREDR